MCSCLLLRSVLHYREDFPNQWSEGHAAFVVFISFGSVEAAAKSAYILQNCVDHSCANKRTQSKLNQPFFQSPLNKWHPFWGILRFILQKYMKLNMWKGQPKHELSNLKQILMLMSLVSHKKSYLVCVELTNFRIFTQPIPNFFFKVQNWDSQQMAETAAWK